MLQPPYPQELWITLSSQGTGCQSCGAVLAMDASAILEQTAPDPGGGIGAYLMTLNGMVGYASDHADRKVDEKREDQEVEYDLEFIHDDDGRKAVEGTDFKILERPRGWLHKL